MTEDRATSPVPAVTTTALIDTEKRKTPTFMSFLEASVPEELVHVPPVKPDHPTPTPGPVDDKVNQSLAYTNERINRLSRRLKKTIERNFESSREEGVSDEPTASRPPLSSTGLTA
jgi:hypothetical protein